MVLSHIITIVNTTGISRWQWTTTCPPKDIKSLELVNTTLIWKRGLCRYDEVKHVEMRSSCIIWVGPKSSKCAYERTTEEDLKQKIWHRRCQGHVKTEADWSDAATSHKTPRAARSWKWPSRDSPPDLLEGVWPCSHLDSELRTSRTVRE